MEKKNIYIYIIFSVSSVYIILRVYFSILHYTSVFIKKSFFCIAFISEKFKIALSVIYFPIVTVKVGFQLPISWPLQLITNRCFLLRENLITCLPWCVCHAHGWAWQMADSGATSREGWQRKEDRELPLLSGRPEEKRKTSRPEFIVITEEMNVSLTLLISQWARN